MIHNFRVENIGDTAAKVFIDDKPIRCLGYSISHNAGEVAEVHIELLPEVYVNEKAIIRFDVEQIAETINEDDFKLLVEKYNEVHKNED